MTDATKDVVVVTGSTRGLGKAITEKLINAGYHVVGTGRSPKKQGMADDKYGDPTFTYYQLELSNSSSVEQFISQVKSEFRSVRGLVNNAGQISRPADLENQTFHSIQETTLVNYTSHFWITAQMKELLSRSKCGCVVNIGSVYGEIPAPPVAAYCNAKAAIHQMTRTLALAYAPDVRVNCVVPGNFATEMTEGAGEETIEWAVGRTPLGRLGKPEEIGDAVEFLLSDRAKFVTGELIKVDGGFNLTK